MNIEHINPWEGAMNITYENLCDAAKEARERHKKLEVKLKTEIGMLGNEFIKALQMANEYYKVPSTIQRLNSPLLTNDAPRVTFGFCEAQDHPISKMQLEPSDLSVKFFIKVGIAEQPLSNPVVFISIDMKIYSDDDCYVVDVDGDKVYVPKTLSSPRYGEVCDILKAKLLTKCTS